jgi:hypothetical protein
MAIGIDDIDYEEDGNEELNDTQTQDNDSSYED